MNTSSGNVLEGPSELQSNETSYIYTFEDEVQYCQILTVNVMAVSALGSSVPGSVSRGFPIGKNFTIFCLGVIIIVFIHTAPHPFQEDANVTVTFLGDGTTMAKISFEVGLYYEHNVNCVRSLCAGSSYL